MRKHFLILMLLALLPLAGWAATAVDLPGDLDVTFTIKDSGTPVTKYTGNNLTVEIATATATVGTTPNTSVLGDVVIGGVYSDFACTNPVTVKNAGTYYVKVIGDGDPYKTTSYTVWPITVAKLGDIKVRALPLAKIYGQPNPTTGYYEVVLPTGFVETGTDDIAKATAAGLVVTPSFKDWEVNKAADVYQFEISTNTVTNYNIVVENKYANLTINKATLIVKAEDKTVEYGTAPVYTVTYGPTLYAGDQEQFGDVAYDVKSTADATKTYDVLKGAVGTYTITPKGLTSDNYNFDYQNGTLTVSQRNISHVTFVMAGTTYNAGDQLANLKKFKTLTDDGTLAEPAEGPKAADFEVSIFENETGGTKLSSATQAKKYWAEITPATTGNYTGTAAARVPVILAKKQLNVITQDAVKDYDGKTYTLTSALGFEWKGLEESDQYDSSHKIPAASTYIDGKFADNFSSSLSTPGATNAGEYTINISSTKAADQIFNNYTVNFVNTGKLTINKVQVSMKPSDLTILYGDQEPNWANVTLSSFDISYKNKKAGTAVTPAALGDDVEEDVFTTLPSINRVIPAGKTAGEVGTYELIAQNYVLKADGNYEFAENQPAKGVLTIQAATSITVEVKNLTAVYGEYADAAAVLAKENGAYKNIDVRLSGVKEADKEKVTINLTVVDNKNKDYAGKRGTYTIKIGDVTLADDIKANYEGVAFTKLDGTFTVNKAPLTLKVLNQSLIADDTKGEALAPASEQTVEILTEGLSDADKKALFTTDATKISLKYSDKLVSGTDYVAATGKLMSYALTHGWDGENPTTGDGIYVNGIEIDATAYNAADVNYTLVLTGEDATVTPGTLYLSNGAYVTFDATATGDDLVSTKLAANNNKTIGVKVILRRNQTVGTNAVSWKAKEWNTMVLPFDISVAKLSAALGYAIVNVVKPEATTGDKVKFQLEMDEIPANTPFAVKTTNAIANDQVIDFGLQTIKYEANPAVGAGADNIFHGAYTSMDITSANPEYRFCAGNAWPHISQAGSKYVVRPFNAYMEIDAANLARDIVFEFEELDGSTTSIKSVDFGSSKAYEADGWYTINGMKLNAAPTEKGIYINNGKKVVVK